MAPTRRLCATLLVLALPGPALADARADLHAAFVKNMAVHSYRATMTDLATGKAVSTVEFQAPDRYRVNVPGRPATVIADNTMYLSVNGRAMKVPLPAGTLDQYRSDAAIRKLEANTVYSATGMATVDGEPARRYHWVATGKHASTGDAWVAVRSGRVIQVESAGKVRVRYSDFDSPDIRIELPR
jgi:hypothetical protein